MAALNYPAQLLARLPQKMRQHFCGLGNVQRPAALQQGERVLDIGCGCGVDTVLAALQVSGGSAIGIDVSPRMVARASQWTAEAGITNASFAVGSLEECVWPDASFDVILSNGVFSLIPAKEAALQKVFALLKPRGRVVIADQTRILLEKLAAVPAEETPALATAEGWAL